MNIQINTVLGLSKLQYINFVDGQFNIWCEHLSHTFYVPMRELQKNNQMYNFFLQQWEKRIVKPFLSQNQEFLMAGIQDSGTYFELFMGVLDSPHCKMIGIYPSVLVKSIKTTHYKALEKNDR